MRERQKLWMPNALDRLDSENPLSSHDLNDGNLIACYWPSIGDKSTLFRELTGNVADGTLTNFDMANAWQPTVCGEALVFDGLNDFVLVPNFPRPAIICVEALVYVPGAPDGSQRAIISHHDGGVSGWCLAKSNEETWRFFVNGTDNNAQTAATFNEWTHLVGCYDGSTIQLYVNGRLADETAFASTINYEVTLTFSGLSEGAFWYYQGKLASARMYDRVLLPEEVAELHQESTRLYPNLINRTSNFVPIGIAAPPGPILDAESGAFALTGQDAALLKGYHLQAEPGVFVLTGQDAELQLGRQLVAESGVLSLTGQDANLVSGKQLTAETAAFIVTGQDADLATQLQLAADQGVFLLTGQDAALEEGEALNANHGVFTLAGADTALQWNRQLEADGGAFTLTGQDTNLVAGEQLTAESGAFDLTGADAELAWGRILLADNAIFLLAGQDANLVSGQQLTAESAAFALIGQDASFERAYQLLADAGNFTLLGRDAFLEYSEAPPPTTRLMIVPAEPRIGVVPKEDRTIRVPKE